MWTLTHCWNGCKWGRGMSVTCSSSPWSSFACYCLCQIMWTVALRRECHSQISVTVGCKSEISVDVFAYVWLLKSWLNQLKKIIVAFCPKNFKIFSVFFFVHFYTVSRCPPRTFLPALCKIFLDESAPDNVLEVTARAITYYLDVSAECTRRIVGVDGAIKALCNRLVVVELNNRTSRDLAEQCVKVRTVT